VVITKSRAAASDALMEYEIVTRSPDELSDKEFNDFKSLILEGGEVIRAGLNERIRKAKRLVLLHMVGNLIGIGALKKQNARYRRCLASKSETCLPAIEYPFELGWIFVSSSYRRKGLAGMIAEAALSVANGVGIFATSRSDNTAIHALLQRYGFIPAGTPYASGHRNYNLQLFVRAPCETCFRPTLISP
jgi:GNAT superfamily N-acetyltransferase